MPVYEYKCRCGNKKDVLVLYSERDSKQVCNKCGETMKRQWSAPALGGMDKYGRSR